MNSILIKSSIKILFGIIHILFFIFSILLLLTDVFLSLKLYNYLNKNIFIIISTLSLYFMLISIGGYFALYKRNRVVIFLYISLCVIGLNIMLYIIKKLSGDYHINLDAIWSRMDNAVKNRIQRKLDCCGFNSINDRSGSKCNSKIPCKLVFSQIITQLVKRVNLVSMTLFTMVSLSLIIISFLKLKYKK